MARSVNWFASKAVPWYPFRTVRHQVAHISSRVVSGLFLASWLMIGMSWVNQLPRNKVHGCSRNRGILLVDTVVVLLDEGGEVCRCCMARYAIALRFAT